MTDYKSHLEVSPWKKDIFKGKVVFATGGAGSIGRVQVEALVLLGANAAIIGRRKEHTQQVARELQALRPGAQVLGIGDVDVRKVDSLAKAVAQTVAELGRIDYVIAGAAGNFLADFGSLSSNAFKSVVEIDLIGSYNTAKAVFPELRKSKGHLLFVTATLHYTGLPFQAHASAAKAGVDALTQVLAVELGPLGIQVNAIAPGPIENTEGLDRLLVGEQRSRGLELVPLQRFGKSIDIADGTVFLFSQAASYVTGTVLVVDGGAWHLSGPANVIASSEIYPKLFQKMGSSETPSKL